MAGNQAALNAMQNQINALLAANAGGAPNPQPAGAIIPPAAPNPGMPLQIIGQGADPYGAVRLTARQQPGLNPNQGLFQAPNVNPNIPQIFNNALIAGGIEHWKAPPETEPITNPEMKFYVGVTIAESIYQDATESEHLALADFWSIGVGFNNQAYQRGPTNQIAGRLEDFSNGQRRAGLMTLLSKIDGRNLNFDALDNAGNPVGAGVPIDQWNNVGVPGVAAQVGPPAVPAAGPVLCNWANIAPLLTFAQVSGSLVWKQAFLNAITRELPDDRITGHFTLLTAVARMGSIPPEKLLTLRRACNINTIVPTVGTISEVWMKLEPYFTSDQNNHEGRDRAAGLLGNLAASWPNAPIALANMCRFAKYSGLSSQSIIAKAIVEVSQFPWYLIVQGIDQIPSHIVMGLDGTRQVVPVPAAGMEVHTPQGWLQANEFNLPNDLVGLVHLGTVFVNDFNAAVQTPYWAYTSAAGHGRTLTALTYLAKKLLMDVNGDTTVRAYEGGKSGGKMSIGIDRWVGEHIRALNALTAGNVVMASAPQNINHLVELAGAT